MKESRYEIKGVILARFLLILALTSSRQIRNSPIGFAVVGVSPSGAETKVRSTFEFKIISLYCIDPLLPPLRGRIVVQDLSAKTVPN